MSEPRVMVRRLAPGTADGPLAVLAHGLEDSWSSWLAVAAEFDPRWRLVALDLPWRPGNDYRWRRRPASEWLAEALELVGGTPDVLVGHSFGAGAALELFSGSPARHARAAVLICPLYRLPEQPVSWWTFDRARATFDRHIRDSVQTRLGERAGTLGTGVLESMMDLAVERVGPAGFLAVFEQFAASGDLPLDAVRLPALVLAGGADPALTPRAAGVLAESMPQARLLVNEEYDHFCHVRHPGDVAAQVARFVEAARTAPTAELLP